MADGSNVVTKDDLAEEFIQLVPEDAEFEVRVNDEDGRYMVASKKLDDGAWFLLESPVVCWPLTQQEGEASLCDFPSSWCEGCLRSLPEPSSEPSSSRRRLTTPTPPRLCEACAQRGLREMLTQEELISWRRWQHQRSAKSCVGLEAFGRCLAQVALMASKAKEAVHFALKPFDRLQGPPGDAQVLLHGTTPAEVAQELRVSEPFQSKLRKALGVEADALLSEETIAQLAGKLVLNAASFSVPEVRQGLPLQSAGVYVLLSTMNHSCAPSVRLDTSANSGAEVSLITTMPLEVGDRLTLAYVTPDWPLEERQQQLSHWFFKCRCPRCEAEGCVRQALGLDSTKSKVALEG